MACLPASSLASQLPQCCGGTANMRITPNLRESGSPAMRPSLTVKGSSQASVPAIIQPSTAFVVHSKPVGAGLPAMRPSLTVEDSSQASVPAIIQPSTAFVEHLKTCGSWLASDEARIDTRRLKSGRWPCRYPALACSCGSANWPCRCATSGSARTANRSRCPPSPR